VNVEGKGIVTITAAAPRRARLLDYAKENFEGSSAFHGVYGGLPHRPVRGVGPPADELLDKLQGFNVRKFACNHCTGRDRGAEDAGARRLPWPAATARHGQQERPLPGGERRHGRLLSAPGGTPP